MGPKRKLDVMEIMNAPEEKVSATLGLSLEDFKELRWDIVDEWKGKPRAEYFDHIGVEEDSVREELTKIGADGGTSETATHLAGRLLLDAGVEEIELKHYLFFTEILKYLGNKSVKLEGGIKGQVDGLMKGGILEKILNTFKYGR